jgi:hypothetical protein
MALLTVAMVVALTLPITADYGASSSRIIHDSFFKVDVTEKTGRRVIVHPDTPATELSEWDVDSETLQRALWARQHPADCSPSRLYVIDFDHTAGPGSYLHVFASCFMHALESGRTVVIAPGHDWIMTSKNTTMCGSRSLECYFLPLSNCTVPGDYRDSKSVLHITPGMIFFLA